MKRLKETENVEIELEDGTTICCEASLLVRLFVEEAKRKQMSPLHKMYSEFMRNHRSSVLKNAMG